MEPVSMNEIRNLLYNLSVRVARLEEKVNGPDQFSPVKDHELAKVVDFKNGVIQDIQILLERLDREKNS